MGLELLDVFLNTYLIQPARIKNQFVSIFSDDFGLMRTYSFSMLHLQRWPLWISRWLSIAKPSSRRGYRCMNQIGRWVVQKNSETSQRKARSIFLNSFLFVLVSGFSVSHFPADDVIAISFTDRKFVTNGPQPQREHETEVPEFFFSLEKNAAKEFSFLRLRLFFTSSWFLFWMT